MKLPAKLLSAAILCLSFILLGGIWYLRQTLDGGQLITARQPDIRIAPYFYQEIGTSRPKKTGAEENIVAFRQYTIELGVVKDRIRAENAIRQLHEKGVEAFFTPINRQGEVIYRIRTGVYSEQELAQRDAKKIQTQHQIESRVNRF